MQNTYAQALNKLKSQQLYRQLKTQHPHAVDFSSNDYLGLSKHPAVLERAIAYGRQWGAGARASRLLAGNLPIHDALEAKIAKTKGTEAALIFPTGYQANATIIAALLDATVLDAPPLVFCDRLNHASMHHGCKLAGAHQIRYRNCDLDHLEELLQKHHDQAGPRFILTETVFSMDGTVMDLSRLRKLALDHKAFLFVDEAHAIGVFGPNGYGVSDGIHPSPEVIMGTFSKAIGASGGYVACSQVIRDYLINKCTGFIYSTGISPMIVGAADAAWDLIPTLQTKRQQLQQTAADLRTQLQAAGLNTGQSQSQIIPVIVGSSETALTMQNSLLKSGFIVPAIRPPTVPSDAARLRFSLTTGHTNQELQQVIALLQGQALHATENF